MKLNVSKTRVISFTSKMNMSSFRYIIFVGLLLFCYMYEVPLAQ
jgi:hypothetical protein